MRTTIGQLLLGEILPADIERPAVLDKKGLSDVLTQIAHKHPARYGEIANQLKDVGNLAAYHSGTSFGLADFKPLTTIRDQALRAHAAAIKGIVDEALAHPERQHEPGFLRRKAEVFARVEDHVNHAMRAQIAQHPNDLTGWIVSGAKGDHASGRQMLAMAGLNVDVAGKLAPDIARRSFSEGLSPVDFHVHAMGARRGVVNTYTSVREPGAFAKELNTLAADMVITMPDCGTHNGRSYPPGDPGVLDRLLAEDVSGIGHRNDLVTGLVQQAMLKRRISSVKVRSPLSCQAPHGVCAACYGLNEDGRIPPMGMNVGLRAAGALTEPLTQLALNTKHTGGVIGAGKSPFRQIMDLMHAPKQLPGSAVLARLSGRVTDIVKAPSGGHFVTVADTRHYVPPELQLAIKPGQRLDRGDRLSHGQLHPAEIVHYKGMDEGRRHFADAVRQLYVDAGIAGHPKIFETIARSVVNLGQVLEPGKHGFVPGEIVHWNAIQGHIRDARTEKVPIQDAQGRILADAVAHLPHYATLSDRHVAELRHKGIRQVPVYVSGELIVQPLMLGTERAALHKGDWLANLGYRFIGQSFKENAASGATADIHSWNPLPAYVHGAEFGQGPAGRY